MKKFTKQELSKLFKPDDDSNGEDNGQITIIGGSELFHGAPLLALKTASRIVDMVFFSTPEKSVGLVAEQLKSQLSSFIWIPWEETGEYINKSDAVLIGPGFMRYATESQNKVQATKNIDLDKVGANTREITRKFLTEFPDKKWVIDAGSLQTMDARWIPEGAIITPNKKEFELLFGEVDINEKIPQKVRASQSAKSMRDDTAGLKSLPAVSNVAVLADKYNCIIVLKGPETIVCSPEECILITNGNAGLTKGGTGDVLAGLTTALYAKNDALLAASAASYIAKAAADELYLQRSTYYNADDLAENIPLTLGKLLNL